MRTMGEKNRKMKKIGKTAPWMLKEVLERSELFKQLTLKRIEWKNRTSCKINNTINNTMNAAWNHTQPPPFKYIKYLNLAIKSIYSFLTRNMCLFWKKGIIG